MSFGIGYKKIHACPKDCIIYRNDTENLNKCPICGLSRYKKSGNEDNEGSKISAKVFWYLPIIPRFRRLFSNPRDAKLLTWHDSGRKKDGNLRHAADSPEWKNIDIQFPDFGGDSRNLRLGLCTDGMNPYGAWSSRHTTWPVILCVYNLPPWLCIKRKY